MTHHLGRILTGLLLATGILLAILLVGEQRSSLPSSFQSPLADIDLNIPPNLNPSIVATVFESPLPAPDRFPSISSTQLADASSRIQDTGLAMPFFGLTWSPSGSGIVYAQLTDKVIVDEATKGFTPVTELLYQDLDSGKESQVASNGRFPRWSPLGNRLLFVSWLNTDQSYVMLTDIDTGATSKVAENGVYAEWLSNNDVAVVDTYGRVVRVDLNSGSGYTPFGADLIASTSGPNSISISPDKQRMAIVNQKQLSVFDFKGNRVTLVTADEYTDIVGGMAWSPHSDRLAYVSNKSIGIARISDEQMVSDILDFQEMTRFPSSLSWSPDSRFLLYQGFDGIWVVNVNSGERKLLLQNTPDSDVVFSTPSWSPDGKAVILENSGNIYVADLTFDTGK